ncbi:hypothetical protein Pla123a_00030 [Posidoniimonas polymericola]|uniref:DUF1570 domain-containing protein n=1 Tax=Posidoniimonas polymericola TaxID=2528002 RepID=A0A5C5ZDP9_9BACT|nr:DUF1570 domain-containing protein [Posidoniimonas polymericola]TWT85197.1 hypothetical protein Pla123a_00030 [Posidoniimonas polymericola]
MSLRTLIALGCLTILAAPAAGADFMFSAVVDGARVEGRPLDWTDSVMTLLGRDGQLHEFDPRVVKDARRTAPKFRGYDEREMTQLLRDEFDKRFGISTTQHYIVVHPRGERSAWTERFEQIYGALVNCVRVRGFRVQQPQFPLVAVVFRNKVEYESHVRGSGAKLLPNSLGFYSHSTNRVCLYDITGGDPNQDWTENSSTIIHEATHQVAFNLGVHSRTSPPPYWIPEGLATLFEARGVWRPSGSDQRGDRVNYGYLSAFRRHATEKKPPFSLREFVASDQPFKRNTSAAYAQAWALSFYLSETRPREFAQHLQQTADRPVYSTFSAAERVSYFTEAFGSDLDVLQANFLQWVAKL